MSGFDSSTALEPALGLVRRRVAALVGSEQEAAWIIEDAAALASAEGCQPLALEMAARRAAGEPLQHVLSHWGFRRLAVSCDRRALVPRPETESVVEIALHELARSPAGGELLLADLGTGSGVIALSLALELERPARIFASDVSCEALELAAENAAALGRGQGGRLGAAGSELLFLRGSWFEALPGELAGRLALVVANPPYLSSAEWDGLAPVVRRFDPYGALVAGPEGSEAIEAIVAAAPRWLRAGGSLVVETAPHQQEGARAAALRAGFAAARTERDLAGRARTLVARL